MPEPLHFRVYPEGRKKRLYFEVHVFRSRKRMYRFYKATGGPGVPNFFAVVQNFEKGTRYEAPGLADHILGQILFAPRLFGPGVVAHEMLHAGMTWADRRGVNVLNRRGEERLALAVEKMTAQFWRRFEKARGVK